MKQHFFIGFALSVFLWICGEGLYSQPVVWCMPSWDCASELTLRHKGYFVSYDLVRKIPAWVAYYIVPERMNKANRRSNDFRPDPLIPLEYSATNDDYKASGFDRGHLAPAADMAWSTEVMSESFYFSNMTPQDPGFNRGIWKKLEDQVRKWAAEYDTMLIITGPLPGRDKGFIGQGKVAVPAAFYKALVAWNHPSAQGIAFVMPNESSSQPLSSFAITIDSLESVLACNLFAALPEPAQQRAESTINWHFWHLKPSTFHSPLNNKGKNKATNPIAQ